MDIENLIKQSPRNLIRMAAILEIIVDELDLQILNRIKGNGVPWEYFEGYSPTTVLTFLKLLKDEYKQTFGVWNNNTELLKIYLEPIFNEVYQEGIIKGWTEDQIKNESNKRADDLVLRRFKDNLVLSISSEQLAGLKEILATLRTKTSLKGTDESNKANFELLKKIPNNRKYKKARKIAEKLLEKSKVDNWILARCITPTLRYRANKRRKFGRNDYLNDKESYNDQIQNRLDTINGKWESLSCFVKFHVDFCELTTLN